jgi:Bacterial Ig-like domain (group 3)
MKNEKSLFAVFVSTVLSPFRSTTPLLLSIAVLACSPFAPLAAAQDGIQYKSSTSTALTAGPNPGYVGQKISLQASVTASGSAVTSGTVTFTVNSAVLGTASLNSSGVATFAAASNTATAGAYSLVATYKGNDSYSASSSSAVSYTLKRPSNSTTSLSVSPNPATVGQNVILTATVSGGTPSGSVNFSVNGYQLGTSTVSSGVAKLSVSTSSIAPGNYPVIAKYSGSSTESPSNSTSVLAVLDAASSGGGGTSGTALSSCADLTTSGTYYLTQNVSSSGTCFFIDADNITLNLNAHTVTYGTGGGSAATPGVLLADNWYTGSTYNLAQTGTTTHHGGFVMYGGNVTAATNSAQRSTAIWVGQSNDISPAPVLHDLTLTTYATDASPIFGTVDVSGWQIYNNTINYASVTTSSRYDFYGYAIWLGDQLNAPGAIPDSIYNNKIIGAPQGGIYDDHQNAIIGPSNDITFNSFYANDYCVIDYAGNGQVIKSNVCHPASGRGFDVESANVQVLDNTITVTELSQDAEYNGCEEAGADGIRVRDNSAPSGNDNNNPTAPNNVLIQGNNITANATVCQANALRFTSLIGSDGDSVTLSGNTITTTGAGTSAIPDYGISFDGVNQPTMTFTNNSFTSLYAFVEVDWDGANVAINSQQNWLNTPKIFVDNENGYNGGSNSPTFSQSIMVDNSTGGTIKCGGSAAGPTQVGSTIKVCN